MKYKPGEAILKLNLDPSVYKNIEIVGCDTKGHAIIERDSSIHTDLTEIIIHKGSDHHKVSIPMLGIVDAVCRSEYRANTDAHYGDNGLVEYRYLTSSINELIIDGFGTISVVTHYPASWRTSGDEHRVM